MKKLFVIFFSLIVYSASAQISFRTGDVRLDADLNLINSRALADFGSFRGDLVRSYGVSNQKIDHMRGNQNMAPGEIYFALEIAKLGRISIDNVLSIYERDKSKGWGYIAKEAGIKPGSAEFHRLKDNASSNKNKGNKKSKPANKGQGNGKNKGKK